MTVASEVDPAQATTSSSHLCLLLWLFGISAWIAVNGVQNQEWKLMLKLDEGSKVAPRITLLTQLGNILPAIYLLGRYA